jgi:hypothetical protein
MYCSILITVSQEEDSNLHMQWCQVCTVSYQNETVHTWHPCIRKLESPSCDIMIRMKQYIPDTPAYVSWNPLLVVLWSECMCCSMLITVSQEGDSNLDLQECQVCTVPFWSQYHKKRIPSYICRGVGYVLFHSDHNITRRGFQLTYAVRTYLTPLHM